MGWNDHVDWELLDDFETLVAHDLIDGEDEELLQKLVEKLAYGQKLTAAEQHVYVREMLPLLARIEELHREEYMDYLISKDD
jgi:ribosome assembly protein YihI (activator of Der GTPase)